MAQITSGQTSYTNASAILNASGEAVRISATQVRIDINWEIYTSGSSLSPAERILRIVNSANQSLGQFTIGTSWARNTWYRGSGSITVSIAGGAGSINVGCMVLTASGGGGTTLTWDGNKNTSTGNPGIQRANLGYGAWDTTKPTVHRAQVGDCNGVDTFVVYAYATNVTSVRVAVWTDENGQDDLEWIDMFGGAWVLDGQPYNYAAFVYRSRHKNEYGKYYADVYGYNDNGNALRGTIFYWTTNVRFNGNGGSGDTAKNVSIGAAYGTLPSSTRTGYTFAGWWTAAIGGAQITAASTMGTGFCRTGVQDLYAHWEPRTFNLNFDATGGTVSPASKIITFDSVIGELPIPVRNGYKFLGWHTGQSDGEMVTADTIYETPADSTVYAHWKMVIRNDLVPIMTDNGIRLAKPYVGNGETFDELAPRIGNGTAYDNIAVNPADYT